MYLIPITPIPTPRPQLGKFGVYNTKKYTEYKKKLIMWISLLKIPKDDYDFIHAKFYIPYAKNTAKKNLIEGAYLKQKFDCDNIIKGLLDALEQSKVIENDRCICSMFVEKFRTCKEFGRIEFKLNNIINE
jgi:Holliday junction resolvase RusA-like endonuclease